MLDLRSPGLPQCRDPRCGCSSIGTADLSPSVQQDARDSRPMPAPPMPTMCTRANSGAGPFTWKASV